RFSLNVRKANAGCAVGGSLLRDSFDQMWRKSSKLAQRFAQETASAAVRSRWRLRFHSYSLRSSCLCFLTWLSISLKAFLQHARKWVLAAVACRVPVGRVRFS